MGMQIQKSKIFAFSMKMSDDFFDCIDWRMLLGRRVDITAIQIDSICVYSIVTSCYSIRVDYGKYVEDKPISKKSGFFAILSDFTDDSSHDMRTGYFSGMYSSSNDETFLFWSKLFRFVMTYKEILVLHFFIFC